MGEREKTRTGSVSGSGGSFGGINNVNNINSVVVKEIEASIEEYAITCLEKCMYPMLGVDSNLISCWANRDLYCHYEGERRKSIDAPVLEENEEEREGGEGDEEKKEKKEDVNDQNNNEEEERGNENNNNKQKKKRETIMESELRQKRAH